LQLDTSLRIGGGDTSNIVAADITVVKDASGKPYIPGSSFKGVLRSQVESLLRTINEDWACLCVTERKEVNDGCPTTRDREKWNETRERLERGGKLDQYVLENSCRACQVFGSPWLASKVLVSDMAVKGEWWGHYQIRDGVAIDRDTGTAGEGLLYSFEAVPAGTEFSCEILVENASEAEQGLVLLGLRAVEHGLVRLGGATSRGLGRVRLRWDLNPECYEVNADPEAGGGPGQLLDYLATGKGTPLTMDAMNTKIAAFRKKAGA
jgi:CRISPR-associated RAMP protein (TIGR02581 family)